MREEQHSGDYPKTEATEHSAGQTPDTEAHQGEDRLQNSVAADQFYQGVIAWVHWGHERGAIRSTSGREIQFEFPFVTVLGEPRKVESLRAGMRVGFDVGQTSYGLRVTKLKIYD